MWALTSICTAQSSLFPKFNFCGLVITRKSCKNWIPQIFPLYSMWPSMSHMEGMQYNISCTYISTTKGTMSCNSCICPESDKQPDQATALARMPHSQWQTPSHSHRASYQWLFTPSLSYRLTSQWVTYMCTYHIADNLCGPQIMVLNLWQ